MGQEREIIAGWRPVSFYPTEGKFSDWEKMKDKTWEKLNVKTRQRRRVRDDE